MLRNTKFRSPAKAPGPRVNLYVSHASDPYFEIKVEDVCVKFRTGGNPTFLTREAKYPSLFGPGQVNKTVFYWAVAILEAQRQFVTGEYPHIYAERMQDLTVRNGAVIGSLRAWPRLTEAEKHKLESKLLVAMNEAIGRWKALKEDLVNWSVYGGGEGGAASHVQRLLSIPPEDRAAYRDLDEAYEEYKRIYRRVYEDGVPSRT